MSDGDEGALVGLIYEAAWAPERWQAVFDETCRLLGLHAAAAMQTRMTAGAPPAFALRALSGVPGSAFTDYRDHFGGRDPNLAFAMRQPVGTLYGEPLGFDREATRRSEVFQDFVRPNGGDCPVVGVLGRDGAAVTTFMAYTPLGRQFTPHQVGVLQRLVPHMCRSLQVEAERRQAALMAAVGSSALDHVAKPLFMVDRSARVHACNRHATDLLDAPCTLFALTADGQLTVRAPSGQRALDRAIAQALRAADGAAPPPIFRLDADGGTVSVMVVPTAGGASGRMVSVLVNIAGARSAPSPTRLQQEFGFTPAEAAIVADLATGLSVEAVATARGLKRDTVYIHVKHAREKTGTSSQAQLVALVLRGLAALDGRAVGGR